MPPYHGLMNLATRIVTGCLTLAAATSVYGQVITVVWREKPPYQYLEGGVEKGALLARARALFRQAGVDARFERVPSKRIWANFQSGVNNTCSFGWYRLPEREALTWFSLPFAEDPPQQVLVGPAAEAGVAAHPTLAVLFADRRYRAGFVDGVSFGPVLDAMIAANSDHIERRTVEPTAMMRMVVAGRYAYTLVDVADFAYYRDRDPLIRDAALRSFPDAPPGLQRHVVCSKDIPASVLARIDRAIRAAPLVRRNVPPDSR